VAAKDGVVVVEVSKPDACAACKAQASCHAASMGGNQVEVRGEGFRVGDTVRIVSRPGTVVRTSLVLYLIPALLVIIGSFAGFATAEAFVKPGSGNIGSLAGVVVGIVLSLVFVHFYRIARSHVQDIWLEKID
jgi:positive regulator of sigma E activity